MGCDLNKGYVSTEAGTRRDQRCKASLSANSQKTAACGEAFQGAEASDHLFVKPWNQEEAPLFSGMKMTRARIT